MKSRSNDHTAASRRRSKRPSPTSSPPPVQPVGRSPDSSETTTAAVTVLTATNDTRPSVTAPISGSQVCRPKPTRPRPNGDQNGIVERRVSTIVLPPEHARLPQ